MILRAGLSTGPHAEPRSRCLLAFCIELSGLSRGRGVGQRRARSLGFVVLWPLSDGLPGLVQGKKQLVQQSVALLTIKALEVAIPRRLPDAGCDDLIFREPLPPHRSSPSPRPDSKSIWRKSSGADHFDTLTEPRVVIESLSRFCNTLQPHGSVGCRPTAPEVFMSQSARAALPRQSVPGSPCANVHPWALVGSRSGFSVADVDVVGAICIFPRAKDFEPCWGYRGNTLAKRGPPRPRSSLR